jgi:hypothetical protein
LRGGWRIPERAVFGRLHILQEARLTLFIVIGLLTRTIEGVRHSRRDGRPTKAGLRRASSIGASAVASIDRWTRQGRRLAI